MNYKFLYKAFKEKRINKVSDKMFQVDDYLVTFQTKKGRVVITCKCWNHGVFPNEGWCWHKELAVVYPIFEQFDKKVDEIMRFIETGIKLKREFKLKEIKTLLEEMRFK